MEENTILFIIYGTMVVSTCIMIFYLTLTMLKVNTIQKKNEEIINEIHKKRRA